MRGTVVQHHIHNQFRLSGWAEDNSRPEPSQGNNEVSNMQWIVKEIIQNNNNEFLEI